VKPESLSSSKYLYSIPESFCDYPAGSFTFVKGLVTKIDYSRKSVLVNTGENPPKKGAATSVTFDYLVIASGSTTPATLGQGSMKLPFKATAFEDTRKAITEAQKKLQNATGIVIGGGGPLGVELAGELAETSGTAKVITLVSKADALLEGATDVVQKAAESLLRRKNVEILKGVTVHQADQDPETKSWTVTLSTGQTITADEYISTTGVIPNNQFIQKVFLNRHGWINVDDQLRVVGDGTSRSDTYAVGDITCHPYRLLSRVSLQGTIVASNIAASIRDDTSLATYSAEAQKKMMVVPVGQSTGTGHIGGWTLWGCLVWYFKGRDFLTYKASEFLRGEGE
jgi:NADH dehydrogenase FAD-containing subunit